MDQLADLGLQDDRRAAQNMTRHMATLRGYGPRKIQQNLRQRGLAKPLIDQALAELEFDFRESAVRLGHKKVRAGDPKARERVARFLASRGFPGDMVWDVAAQVVSAAGDASSTGSPEAAPSWDASGESEEPA